MVMSRDLSLLCAAWAGATSGNDALLHPSRCASLRGFPHALRMHRLDYDALVAVSFSLGRLKLLTPSELAVARLANAELSNAAVARLRATSPRTVAGQMRSILKKLQIGSRLALSTIPELGA
jgi:DNA-binding CsgD family transcriptional regulator